MLLQRDIHPVVFGDARYITLQPVADLHRTEQLVAVEHSPVTIVQDDAIPDFILGSDQDIDLFARPERQLLVVDESVEQHGRYHTAGYIVVVEEYHVAPARFDASLHVAVGQEKVFCFQAPVEESAVDRFVHHLEAGRFTDGCQRPVRRRDEAVFRIAVYDYVQFVAHFVFQ